MTSVDSSKPVRLRSAISAAIGWSVSPANWRWLPAVQTVQAVQKIDLSPLGVVGHAGRSHQIVDRRTLRVEGGPLVDARQETSAPVRRVALRQPAAERVVHDDERRQVLALRAEPVR